MGYYTRYHLEMKDTRKPLQPMIIEENAPDLYKAVAQKFEEIFGYDVLDDLVDYTDDWKWYEWEIDMRKLAAAFPFIRFNLEGEGEDREDWWYASFLGDKFQVRHANVTPPWDSEPEEF